MSDFQVDLFKVAEVEIYYRTTVKNSMRPTIFSSSSSVEILCNNWDLGKIEHIEEFKVLLLNRANKVLGIYPVSSGGITNTVAVRR